MPSALAASLIVTPNSSRLSPMSSPGCGGFFMSMDHWPSMIIHEVDFRSLAPREAENDSPVRTHRHRPKALEVAFERVQSERWQIKRIDHLRGMQESQDLLDPTHMI